MQAQIVADGDSVTVQCSYTSGDPAVAELLVHSPQDATRYFAVLRTDELGQARFSPDAPGVWKVVADDGIGHRVTVEFRVRADGGIELAADSGAVWRRYILLAGACLGVALWWAAVRRRGRR